jgi:purine-binding chemotaxis protein CheW
MTSDVIDAAAAAAQDASSGLSEADIEGSILSPAPELRRVLVFAIAGRSRCADISEVREIVPITETTRLPGAPRFVRGLINLRGTLVTVMDAALCLYGVPADGANASILLVERNGRLAGVIVDNVFDIQALPVADVEGGALLDLRALLETAIA